MIAPTHYQAGLRETPLHGDPDTKNPAISSAWLGMSISGEVTAPLVYAHSGNPEDYDLLRKNGISVKGKVVLVRYSNPYSYRGFKALTAQREGVAALLIYSDPAEDGYRQGRVVPMAPSITFSAGAITYDFMVPGDPQTRAGRRCPMQNAFRLLKQSPRPRLWPYRSGDDALREAPAREHGRPRCSGQLARRIADSIPPWRRSRESPSQN